MIGGWLMSGYQRGCWWPVCYYPRAIELKKNQELLEDLRHSFGSAQRLFKMKIKYFDISTLNFNANIIYVQNVKSKSKRIGKWDK